MKRVIVFILVGVLLVCGVIATGTYGLSEENVKIYKQAVSLEDENNFGFYGFAIIAPPINS